MAACLRRINRHQVGKGRAICWRVASSFVSLCLAWLATFNCKLPFVGSPGRTHSANSLIPRPLSSWSLSRVLHSSRAHESLVSRHHREYFSSTCRKRMLSS